MYKRQFQALIKLGLVPYGEICGQKEDSPTLTYNTIGRHVSKMVYTKVVSNKSPWLQKAQLGGCLLYTSIFRSEKFLGKDHIVNFLVGERLYLGGVHLAVKVHTLCFLGKYNRYMEILCRNTGNTDTGSLDGKDLSLIHI